MTQTNLVLLLIALFGFSGFFLKYLLKFNVSSANCRVPLYSVIAGVIVSTQMRDFTEAIVFFLATLAQFAAFIFVSRLRQRGSFFWHAMAALASNGTWFITLHIINVAHAYWLLFVPYILGLIAGRIAGVNWTQFIEQKYQLKSDATRDERLKPGQRLNYIKKEPTFWVLVCGLLGYVAYSSINLSVGVFHSILIVVGLGILQNFFGALATRASQRGNSWYIALTGLLSGLIFYLSAVFLLSKDMDFLLIVPYMLATTLGSTIGAFISMIFEWTMKLQPDTHLEVKTEPAGDNWKKKIPYIVILALATVWVFSNELVFKFMGYTPNQLVFPISFITVSLPRAMVMISVAVIFMLDTALHTIASRAGNRNNITYHVISLIPKGLTDFLKASYLSLNSSIPDVIPVAILANCLGTLFGKDISEKIERWLQAKMDVK